MDVRQPRTSKEEGIPEDRLYRSLLTHSPDPERFLADLTDSLADAVVVISLPELCIDYANKAFTEILGYAGDEVVGVRLDALLLDDTRRLVFEERLAAAIENGKARFRSEQVLSKKDGGLVWTEIVSTLLERDAKIHSLVSVIRDITDRKLAEEALIRSQARLELLNSILAGMKAGTSVEEMIELTLDRLQFPRRRPWRSSVVESPLGSLPSPAA